MDEDDQSPPALPEPLKSWDVLWPETVRTHDKLLGRYPEALAVIRACVGQMTNLGCGALPGAPSKPAARQSRASKLRGLFGFLHPRAIFGRRSRRGNGPVGERVLFVPLFDRSYCLDACGLIIAGLEEEAEGCDVESLVLTPPVMTRETNRVPAAASWKTTSDITNSFPRLSVLLRVIPAYCAFVRGVRANDAQRALMREAFGRWWLVVWFKFLAHYRYMASATRWMEREKVTKLVGINDLVGSAAWLFGAAHLLKKRSYLIMHGISGPQNWPFLADECWVWGERSYQALQDFGAPASRLKMVGHLEIELMAAAPEPEPAAGSDRRARPLKLLILSQICARFGWKTNVFSEVFEVACKALGQTRTQWELVIRCHPSDGESGMREIESICSDHGVAYTFSAAGTSLEDDIGRCDFALTVNSTALLSALLWRRPCVQYFPAHFRDRFGQPFLSDELVVTTPAGLADCLELDAPAMARLLDENREAIFSNRGSSPALAARRLLEPSAGSLLPNPE